MSNIREEMPLLNRHAGEWEGTYTIIDTLGNVIDKHHSYLIQQLPTDGDFPFYQINKYTWDDGKFEEHHFPATYHNKKIWFNTERLEGFGWEADNSIVILYFTYKTIPDVHLYEMIHLSSCGNYRDRTMHWFKNNQAFQRTIGLSRRANCATACCTNTLGA